MASSQVDPEPYKRAHPRISEPKPAPRTLSGQLHWLSIQKQKASTWWANEVKQLILPAERLEARPKQMALQGILAGIVIGLTLAWYIGLGFR